MSPDGDWIDTVAEILAAVGCVVMMFVIVYMALWLAS